MDYGPNPLTKVALLPHLLAMYGSTSFALVKHTWNAAVYTVYWSRLFTYLHTIVIMTCLRPFDHVC